MYEFLSDPWSWLELAQLIPMVVLGKAALLKSKTFEGRIILKKGPASSVAVRVQASDSTEAKKLIEAQYSGQIKSWFQSPREVKD